VNKISIIKDLWGNLNNSKKISSNILSNNSVETRVIEDKAIVIIKVPKADKRQNPLHFCGAFVSYQFVIFKESQLYLKNCYILIIQNKHIILPL
jgi:hypothetical protein